jgi:bifunctional ADP-heptose synthase (sugar kinase/adenylyltransferase)
MKKVRYVDTNSNQMIMRLDENDVCGRIENLRDMSFSDYDAIVISDYNKGFLHVDDIQYICEKYEDVFIDTKKEIDDWIMNVKYIKINSIEYNNNVKYIKRNDNWLKDKLIVTRGKYGCEFNGNIFDVENVPIKDVSGAGDTFLSALVVEYIKSQDIIKSIRFAQKCTTMVVQKQGVTTV